MQAAIAVPPRGAPSSLHVQLPPDPIEDGAEAGRCLVDLHSLRDEWQVAQGRRLSGDKVSIACLLTCTVMVFIVGAVHSRMDGCRQGLRPAECVLTGG